ncbi:hypothetical protein P171DRAFT_477875 [Karstenula rhodostoma CBS 690.94]|uniref:Uncharacterized protein n=1 Tax=Karstenula rhodostoma CBS 690.94 TaxID=1392251 RepID=A0A9P4P5Z3_9PLEO|nr:hypothetical protein P171DRAFT_477875 [Karstenula rhodostoma CBS 690.94]
MDGLPRDFVEEGRLADRFVARPNLSHVDWITSSLNCLTGTIKSSTTFDLQRDYKGTLVLRSGSREVEKLAVEGHLTLYDMVILPGTKSLCLRYRIDTSGHLGREDRIYRGEFWFMLASDTVPFMGLVPLVSAWVNRGDTPSAVRDMQTNRRCLFRETASRVS